MILAEAGLTQVQWRDQWEAARWFQQADGESGKRWGNETIRVTGGGERSLRMPAPLAHLANARHGRYVFSGTVEFAHRGQEWADRVAMNRAVAYRIHFSQDKQRWYLEATWQRTQVPTVPLEALRAAELVGVDMNADHRTGRNHLRPTIPRPPDTTPRAWRSDGAHSDTGSGVAWHRPNHTRAMWLSTGPHRPHQASDTVRQPATPGQDHGHDLLVRPGRRTREVRSPNTVRGLPPSKTQFRSVPRNGTFADVVLVAGVDSSTQSCKVLICDADSGEVVRSASSPHPDGTEVDPQLWWSALQTSINAAGGIDDVAAVAVGAQQHGMVCLDSSGAVVRDALLWNDTRSSVAAAELVDELGGADEWAKRIGVVPVAAITAAKLRWLADHEPEHADATAAVCLPHDWLTWQLSGSTDIREVRTDRSDASGTGYFSSESDSYQEDLLELAMRGRRPVVPAVLGPREAAGQTTTGAVLGPGAGDNAGAALGLGAGPGDCVVSLGTSGVVSAVGDVAAHDPEGIVAGFADATGRQLPLVCTLNGAPVLAAVAAAVGVGFHELDRLALSAPAGAEGLTLVPYFEGERSPNLPGAAGALHGLTVRNLSAANVARAAVEGLLSSMAYCIDKIAAQGAEVRRIMLVGGGARSEAVRRIAPAILGADVHVPTPAEYVALGAARQAAWVLARQDSPPRWSLGETATYSAAPTPQVLEQYRAAQPRTLGQ